VIFVIVASYIFRADNPTDADVLFVRPLFTQSSLLPINSFFRAQLPTGAGSVAGTSNEYSGNTSGSYLLCCCQLFSTPSSTSAYVGIFKLTHKTGNTSMSNYTEIRRTNPL